MTTATSAAGHGHAGQHPPATIADRIGLAMAAVAWVATATVALTQPQLPLDRFTLIGTTLAAACGAIIVVRTGVRLIGWPLVVAGVTWPLLSTYFQGGANPPPETPLTEFLVSVGETGNTMLLLLVLVFPTGRLDTRLQRVLAVVILGPLVLTPWEGLHLVGLLPPAPEFPLGAVFAVFAVLVLLLLGMQVRRYRRRPRVEQLQVKWFLLGVATYLAYPVIFALDLQFGASADIVITSAVPLAVLAAITRYRLYEIDRLISRTVSYAVVVALLAATFVGGVAGLTTLLPAQDDLAVAVTTVAVVGLFTPLLRRVRDVVDRRFDRTRYQAQQVVEQFGRTIRAETDLDAVTHRIHDVLGATLAPTTVAVWRPRAGGAP